MLGLLGLAAIAIFLFTVRTARLELDLRKESLAARQLGRYSLDEKLGEGGMGVVYRAHHAMLHRPTAIKLLSPEKTNDDSIARFEREVQLTSKLNHPNTITIYDYGHTPEGIFYYAMEYLDGIDLQTLVDRDGPQPEGRVVHILTQVCGSLAEAHAVGLIHRDIKPANILLNLRGGVPDLVKVLDFGLVKAVETQDDAGVTAANALLGTPLYMPPEMIHGNEPVDGRADLYTLGAVGYFLLTGHPPFDKGSVSALLYKQVHEPPEPPSTRLGQPVSRDLEAVLLRCLAKRPSDRFPNANALADALLACKILGSWTTNDAESWWQTRAAATPPAPTPAPTPEPASSELQATLAWVSKDQYTPPTCVDLGVTRPDLNGE
jgi:serine/threonine protein kinase